MLGTKVEITLPKAEPGTWSTLSLPKTVVTTTANQHTEPSADSTKLTKTKTTPTTSPDDNDSDVDLNDIEQVRGVKITDA